MLKNRDHAEVKADWLVRSLDDTSFKLKLENHRHELSTGRGLQSSTYWLNVSIFCGIRRTVAKAEAWCLLIHADVSLSLWDPPGVVSDEDGSG
jgi:hypothetical protein